MRRRVQEIVEAQGWTEHTLCELALNYISDTGESADFVGYLKDIAAQENGDYEELPFGEEGTWSGTSWSE
jgi:hypothetical protein